MIFYKRILHINVTIERMKKMREVNEEKREKFIEFAGKRVNNVLHDIQILEPMARSNAYDFTKQDVEDMFKAMQETLLEAKEEFYKKFDERAKAEKKTFSFSSSITPDEDTVVSPLVNEVTTPSEVTTTESDEEL